MDDKFEEEYFSSSVEEEDVEPPFNDIVSKYESLEKWLTAICNEEKNSQINLDYVFGLFESDIDFTVYLIGNKEYQKSEYESIIKIEFRPKDMYFVLPKTDYNGLTNEQVRQQLSDRLIAFSKTPTFKDSFFATAATVKVSWQPNPILTKI